MGFPLQSLTQLLDEQDPAGVCHSEHFGKLSACLCGGKMIRLYNTLTRKKEDFQTLEPNAVRMYVCGVTVYNDAHVGHAMSALVFDVIRRYLGSQELPEVDFRLKLDPAETAEQSLANQGLRLQPGDYLVSCSDGLSDLVAPEEILGTCGDFSGREGIWEHRQQL